jgi:Leucine-rich repeat (LRR) protein
VRTIPKDKLGQITVAAIGLLVIIVAAIGMNQYFAAQDSRSSIGQATIASLPVAVPTKLETPEDVQKYVAALAGAQPYLKELDLQNLPATDAALRLVPKFKMLRDLKLQMTRVTADGLQQLGGMQLEELEIDHTQIGDSGIAVIAKISSLRELLASDTGLTDEGVTRLSALSNLEKLEIRDNPKITNKSVDALSKLSELEVLRISGTGITDNGVKSLQLALPNCIITAGATDIQPGQD